jgi:hypothetical protein
MRRRGEKVTGDGGRVSGVTGREPARAGGVQLTERDIRALVWCADMYGLRADLLAALLGVSGDVVRQLHARWRRAGLAETGRLGPGPVWCWLSRAGLEACGLPYAASRPPLGRLGHVHAAGSVRAALEDWDAYQQAGAYWRSERRLRWRLGSGAGRRGHIPDGEIMWPETSPHYAGQVWCAEIELTPKTVARTAGIMAAVLSRDTDYGEEPGVVRGLRYARVLYACAPGARGTVERARASLPPGAAARVEVRDLPPGALS